jgi:hypothetical protein
MKVVRGLDLQLEMSYVLWCQGEDPSGGLSTEEQTSFNRELMLEAHQLLNPAILHARFALLEVREQSVVLDGGAVFSGRMLADRFGLAEEVALALCTVGSDLEDRVMEYRKGGDEVRAVLLDGIGTAAIGELTEIAHALIRDDAQERGWQASAPFRPGQLDWPLEDHGVFFQLLPAEKLGLKLDPNHLMVPSKSGSMAVGLGEEMSPIAKHRACKYCPIADECRFSQE